MKKIRLLDCTLRDGGYINDWKFGYNSICDMITQLEKTGTDIIELGFLKNQPYNNDRTVFNSMSQITQLIEPKKPHIEYAAMIEVVNPIPLELIEEKTDNTIDIIRVIIWKNKRDKFGNICDALQEGFEYCKGIVERGYKLCIQPARVEQYTDEEFITMLNLFQRLNPMAVYIVDSWGTLCSDEIRHYAILAERYLDSHIALGYHGHNNMMQAYGSAVDFISQDIDRTLIVDASVYGIGRGAGNLNLEVFAKYLNTVYGKNYDILPMISVYEKYIKAIYQEQKWGYSFPYYLSAIHHCNPNYAGYYDDKLKLDPTVINKIMSILTDEDKIIFSTDTADKYYNTYLEKNKEKD